MPSTEDGSLLRLVVDALPIGVVVVDPRGDILLSNPAALHIWGETLLRSGDERWQRSRGWWHDTGVPLERHEWASVRAIAEGKPQVDQLVDIEGFDGSKRTIRNSAVPVVDGGDVRGAVIVFEDVTERLELTARLARAQKLEAAGRLASGVAHDFNNLLTVISTYVDLTLDTLPPADPRHQDLEHVRTAAESATGLTRQLLAFARSQPSQPRDVHVEDTIRRVSGMLPALLGESIRLELRLDADGHRTRIDPSQLEQIVLNLAVNARDAMPDGGDLLIETRTGPSAAHVEIRVRDSGVGMDETTRQRVFEPFFHDRGGAIAIESEPGRGATFTIQLPLAIGGRSPRSRDTNVE
jgi:two-component system cell cycle sensor histidine kinase/response regulator CckA